MWLIQTSNYTVNIYFHGNISLPILIFYFTNYQKYLLFGIFLWSTINNFSNFYYKLFLELTTFPSFFLYCQMYLDSLVFNTKIGPVCWAVEYANCTSANGYHSLPWIWFSFCFVLCHFNHCGLSNAKSCFYIYI